MDITSTEQKMAAELKREESTIVRFLKSSWFLTILVGLVIIAIAGGVFYLKVIASRVYIENALVEAPSITLAPQTSGILQQLYVQEGDIVPANTPVARVGNEIITTQVQSEVISVANNVGKIFNPGDPVVTVIDPSELRVVGTLDEDKGLSAIKVGQTAVFTVDTFGSKKYVGVVDEISPTSHEGDVVFNISDQRQVSQYDVKVRFETSAYPELRNGMSAKIWVYKN
jgi:multidrug resistance efflux pump